MALLMRSVGILGIVSSGTTNRVVARSLTVVKRGMAVYSDKVQDHYENPRNVGTLDKDDPNVGTGMVGAPSCGDVMRLQIKLDENNRVSQTAVKAFGCGSAIASTSYVSDALKGKTIEEALEIKNGDIAKELRLPPVKLHCSVLAEDAIKAAIKDVLEKRKKAQEKA